MPWMIPAAIIGSTLLSSSMQSDAAGQAASQQGQSSQAAIDESKREFDLSRSDTQPYRDAGSNALGRLQTVMGIGGDTSSPDAGSLSRKFSVADFWKDPVVQLGYQSGLDLGTKALKNRAPLTTGLDSGAALKELTQFGTDYTGMKAGDSYNRYLMDQGNQYNKLAALAGIGQTGVGQVTQAGTQLAANTGNILTAQGNANAAATIAKGNAFSGGLNSISNWWQSQNMLNRMYPQSGGAATPMFSYPGYDSAGGQAYG